MKQFKNVLILILIGLITYTYFFTLPNNYNKGRLYQYSIDSVEANKYMSYALYKDAKWKTDLFITAYLYKLKYIDSTKLDCYSSKIGYDIKRNKECVKSIIQ